METTKIVILWSHPRSVSTCFERAFIQREDYITFHEPFGEAAYFGPERMYGYYDDKLHEHAQYLNTTYSEMIEKILKAASNGENKKVFIKDMPRHVVRPDYKSHPENPTALPIDFLKRCTHSCIIRTPEKAIPSNYRGFRKANMNFIPEDIGYSELLVLLEFLTKLTGTRPALIDASDLLADPPTIMRMYCESGIGDRFEPSMMHWSAGRVEAFDKWPGWHDNAQQSTGFNLFEKPADEKEPLVLPDDVQQSIKDSMPIYNTLYQMRLNR